MFLSKARDSATAAAAGCWDKRWWIDILMGWKWRPGSFLIMIMYWTSPFVFEYLESSLVWDGVYWRDVFHYWAAGPRYISWHRSWIWVQNPRFLWPLVQYLEYCDLASQPCCGITSHTHLEKSNSEGHWDFVQKKDETVSSFSWIWILNVLKLMWCFD